MAIPAIKHDEYFTYREYRNWPEDDRWELIDGIAYEMAGPNRAHQTVVGEIFFRIREHLDAKPCRVYAAPFDVLLPRRPELSDDEVDTVVQPDVVVFCDQDKLTEAGARGAPDLCVEVLAPWNLRHDLDRKFHLYERVGVREYWIVDPLGQCLTVYRLEGGKLGDGDHLAEEAPLSSRVLPGLVVPVSAFFRGLE